MAWHPCYCRSTGEMQVLKCVKSVSSSDSRFIYIYSNIKTSALKGDSASRSSSERVFQNFNDWHFFYLIMARDAWSTPLECTRWWRRTAGRGVPHLGAQHATRDARNRPRSGTVAFGCLRARRSMTPLELYRAKIFSKACSASCRAAHRISGCCDAAQDDGVHRQLRQLAHVLCLHYLGHRKNPARCAATGTS